MVLGDVARLALLASLLSACAEQTPPADQQQAPAAFEVEAFEVAGRSLSLWNDAGACILRTADAKFDLEMAAPCRFIRAPGEQTPQAKTYPDAEDATVVIVVGEPETPDAPLESFLGRRSRGLLVRPAGVTLSERISDGRWSLGGADEKEFWLFAH